MDLSAISRWTPSAQERALELYRDRIRSDHKPFYCPRPGCDGNPHNEWKWTHARADQHPPPLSDISWSYWAILAGRAAGKTRAASEMVHKMAMSGKYERIALVARTGPDGRETMVEGASSGIMATAPVNGLPEWAPSTKRLTWPNGCIGTVFSAEEPDRLRGPQHAFAWLDEAAHMPLIADVWSNLKLGLRLGRFPRVIITTTPLPTKWIKELIANPRTLVTRTSSRANLANLAESFEQDTIIPLEGTRLGRQEIDGEILSDVPGALWTADLIESARYNPELIPITLMERVVVAVDPAGTSTRRSDETGIVVLGSIGDQVYVLADWSGKYTPSGWANRVVAAFEMFGANRIIAEKNYGGELVESNMRHVDQTLPIEMVTSRRNKILRAEPVVTTYEQGRVHHPMRALTGNRVSPLEVLEDQMTTWVSGTESPDRLDALVHGATFLTRGSNVMVMASGSYRSPAMAGSQA